MHCATSGERGTRHDGGRPGAGALASAREGELAESCRILGAEPPVFWRLPDGGLAGRDSEAPRVARAIRTSSAALVVTLGADGAYGHPDHVALHRWVVSGWLSLEGERPPLLFAAFPRGLFLPQWEKCRTMMGDPPHPPASAIGTDHADYQLDISAIARTKLRAIAAHRTQLRGGDPEALFPPGIVGSLFETERFSDAAGSPRAEVAALLAGLA